MRDIFANGFLYCKQGIIAHVRTGSEAVEQFIYFQPRTTQRCLHDFPNEVTTNNPYLDSDVIASDDYWGFNKK